MTLARWQRAFGPAVIASANVLAAARTAPGDYRTVLHELGITAHVVRTAVDQLEAQNDGEVVDLSPLAADVRTMLPETRWSRKAIAKLVLAWLGLPWRRDFVYDRGPVVPDLSQADAIVA